MVIGVCLTLGGCPPDSRLSGGLAGIRGVWVQARSIITPERVDETLDRVEAGHFNVMFVNIFAYDHPYYESAWIEKHPDVPPDYDPLALRQTREQTDLIRETVEKLGEIWEHPEDAAALLYPDLRDTYTRHKQIFYDTDGIYESQEETVRVCDACPGWLRINSQARGNGIRSRRIWAMSVPHRACGRCAREA